MDYFFFIFFHLMFQFQDLYYTSFSFLLEFWNWKFNLLELNELLLKMHLILQ